MNMGEKERSSTCNVNHDNTTTPTNVTWCVFCDFSACREINFPVNTRPIHCRVMALHMQINRVCNTSNYSAKGLAVNESVCKSVLLRFYIWHPVLMFANIKLLDNIDMWMAS